MLKGRMYKFKIENQGRIDNVLGICIDNSNNITIVGIDDCGLEYKKSLLEENIEYQEIKLSKYDVEIRELFNKIYTDYWFNRCSTLCYKYSTETNKKQRELLGEIIVKLGFVTRDQFERYIIDNTCFDSVRILGDKLELSKTNVIKKENFDKDKDKHTIKTDNISNILNESVDVVESGFDDKNLYFVQTVYYKLDMPINFDTANTICSSFKKA